MLNWQYTKADSLQLTSLNAVWSCSESVLNRTSTRNWLDYFVPHNPAQSGFDSHVNSLPDCLLVESRIEKALPKKRSFLYSWWDNILCSNFLSITEWLIVLRTRGARGGFVFLRTHWGMWWWGQRLGTWADAHVQNQKPFNFSRPSPDPFPP
jgi:hypothetical protein